MKILDLLKENHEYKVSYSAVVLENESRQRILNHLSIPNDWKVICHHMTIKMGELPENLKEKIGHYVTLQVTKLGKSDLALAVGVETSLSQNVIPHITVAINALNGAKPKDSNAIQDWTMLDEPFTVKGRVEEVMFKPPLKSQTEPTVLNVFDFDGTLMDSPLPEPGKKLYKEITGNDYPHRGWWGQTDSLEPFDVQPIEKNRALHAKYSAIPNSINVIMTNRIPKFERIVKDKLAPFYPTFDYYDFKSGGAEKPERVLTILKNNPSIKVINVFDDMDDQISKFNEFKMTHPEYEINIHHV